MSLIEVSGLNKYFPSIEKGFRMRGDASRSTLFSFLDKAVKKELSIILKMNEVIVLESIVI